jgi:hypothetical protein
MKAEDVKALNKAMQQALQVNEGLRETFNNILEGVCRKPKQEVHNHYYVVPNKSELN